MVVEPHWTLAPRPLAVDFDLEAIWRRARRFPLAGREVLGMALEDLFVALSVHGSKHEWTELRWICDLAELLARHPGIDWPAALARAEAQGCARMLRLGLALANRALGTALPAAVRAAVEADATARALAAEVLGRLFDVDYDPPSVFRVSRFRLRMRERARDRFACLARTLSTPQIAHVRLLRLPPALRPLYGVVTPAIDYLALPLRRRLGPRLLPGPGREARAALAAAGPRLAEALGALAGEALAAREARLGEALGARARLLALGPPAPPGAAPWSVAAGTGSFGCEPAAGVRCAAGPELPFAAESFDAVLCRAAWLPWEDPGAGLAELRRVLRPGGRALVAAFAPLAANPWLAAVDCVARELVGDRALSLRASLGPFAGRGVPGRLLRRAGFARVEEATHFGALEPAAARDAARALAFACTGLDPADLPAATREAVAAALAAALPAGVVRVGVRAAVGVRS
jgi:SAM-dependent methyltransferase